MSILNSNTFIQSKVYELVKDCNNDLLLITKDRTEAQLAAHAACMALFDKSKNAKENQNNIDKHVFVLPDFRAKYGDDLNSFHDELMDLLVTLRQFYNNALSPKILISPFHSILHPLPKKELFDRVILTKNSKIKANLQETLFLYGYEMVQIVEIQGEASIRGDVIDIFIPGHEYPYRISLFDDEIESIRIFSTQTQLSNKEEIDEVVIYPALFALDKDSFEEINQQIQNTDFKAFSKDMATFGLWYLKDRAEIVSNNFNHKYISQGALDLIKENYDIDENLKLNTNMFCEFMRLDGFNRFYDLPSSIGNLESFLISNQKKNINIISSNEAGIKTLNIPPHIHYEKIIAPFIINITDDKEVFISLNTIQNYKYKSKKIRLRVNELNIGEYVIHEQYGIGVFKGIFAEKIMGVIRDFIRIDYMGDDRLLLPVENLNMIERFVSDGDTLPIIDRLGKGSFAKLKAKVREKLFAIANEIIKLAAKRSLIQGQYINTTSLENKLKLERFKSAGNFILTKDQEKSIEEIYADFDSRKVMDRLLSGDVGFGKTEVAMNAIYAAYLSGFQSVVIVPTTLLSSQHFKSLESRFEEFGLKIARLDRFVKNKTQILSSLKLGQIDAVVGTHALLNAEFKNLGLIVIDEEHKFGVKQKEKIKELSNNIHVLSMSATPIPRTLNMALSNLKTLSSLRTPPSERLPVKTFVKVADEVLLKEVIMREIRRGGGIFYIHNNIESIDKQKMKLQRILPNLRISILHSKIDSTKAEEIVLDFYQGKSDVLLATSIVESGIHLPNANTIIINNADRFGIADLHQLRGRVGRGNKEGFCYFLIKDIDSITAESKSRLIALEKNSYLGSGENLAYHDLEIRGGGNLLGISQSGHIKNIGYALYLKMLEECINELTQKEAIKPKDAEIKIHINAFLNSELITSDSLRLDLYRRLCFCKSEREVYDIEGEIEDRFGKLDSSSLAFLELMRIKILATKAGISLLSAYEKNISFTFTTGEKIVVSAPTRDKDDVIECIIMFLRQKIKSIENQ